MDVSLVSEAKQAEDVASGLQIWLDAIPQCATDISANISELFAISSALRSLDNALDPKEYEGAFPLIKKQLDLILKSLQYTLGAVREMFGQSRLTSYAGSPPYRKLWDALGKRFKGEGPSLCSRLELYRVFILELFGILTGSVPTAIIPCSSKLTERDRDSPKSDTESLSLRIKSLVRKQGSLESYFEKVTLGSMGIFFFVVPRDNSTLT